MAGRNYCTQNIAKLVLSASYYMVSSVCKLFFCMFYTTWRPSTPLTTWLLDCTTICTLLPITSSRAGFSYLIVGEVHSTKDITACLMVMWPKMKLSR